MRLAHRPSLALVTALTAAPAAAAAAPGDFTFGIPQTQSIYGELGYSGVPRIGYIAPLSPTFALGGEFIVDVGLFNSLGTGLPGTVTIAGGAPIRIQLVQSEKMPIRLGFTPGIGVNVRQVGYSVQTIDGMTFGVSDSTLTQFALLLHSELHVGLFQIEDKLTFGARGYIPMTLLAGDLTNFIIPILAGPVTEYELGGNWKLTGKLGFGPHIITGDGSRVDLGFEFQVGIALGL